jgi:hypothetical protein
VYGEQSDNLGRERTYGSKGKMGEVEALRTNFKCHTVCLFIGNVIKMRVERERIETDRRWEGGSISLQTFF